MDEAQYRLRRARDEDLASLARILHRLDPERTVSEAELRHSDAVLRGPSMVHLRFVVEEGSSGVAVGFGEALTQPDSADPRYLWCDVTIDPDHQGRGIGRLLAATVEGEARSRGTHELAASARADRPRDLTFLERSGFQERRRRWWSRLSLPAPTTLSLPPRVARLARQGITFTTLAEEGPHRLEVQEGVFRLFNSVLEDEPRIGPFLPSTFEQFVDSNCRGPGFLPEAFFLARKDGRYIAVCNLETLPDEPGVLHQMLTGTLSEFRGRGIATVLKLRTVAYGEAHGYRSIRTSNDSLNHPMWAINQKLGFRREVEHVEGVKPLDPARSGGTALAP